ncbi:hypothetical protein LTR36_001119 [Oleoguttula mirabilis]|uniref:Zn(2)-C6 fungal-type domain-containing protein n=1 Tax=Oleoguttula mirabilis TaxID=1507867 RepID=A0AAV9JQ05_9PEZI|nr:hypothetical protein LTR36_001119 [Oleoguttula mirabilis]
MVKMVTAQGRALPLRKAPVQHRHHASELVITQSPSTPFSSDGLDNERPAKKSRTSKPKVRTGCQTCKIRRVKCDESKPGCSRCTSTGRKCDGYSVPPRKQRSKPNDILPNTPTATVSLTLERCLEGVPGASAELHALQFFQDRTAPALSSYFDADFWTRLVFQMSMAEPAIRHAMVAVGSLHQQREGSAGAPPMLRSMMGHDPSIESAPVRKRITNHNDQFAMVQYNKAISHLSKRLQDPVCAIDIALLTCILFICVEFIRGDVDPALQHFKSGMSIAISSLSDHRSECTMATSALQRTKEIMLPFFNRLELLSALFGHDAQWPYPVELQSCVPSHFTSIKEARDSIVHLMNLSIRYSRSVKQRKHARLVLPDDLVRQEALLHHIRTWQTTFDALLLTHNFTAKELDAAKVLRIHQLAMYTKLSTSTHAQESANDAYTDTYETVVSLGEALQAHAGTREQRQTYPTTFLFDMEIVSPLYHVALKCRHPRIRRRAIALLRHSVRREGLWDSNMAAAIASHIMRIEEAHLTALDGTQLPAEEDRIRKSHIQSAPGAGLEPNAHTVTFYSKPPGVGGQWHIWTEKFVLDEPSSNYLRTSGREGAVSGKTVVLMETGHKHYLPCS